ncbi:conserved hypothetical protein [Cenarchaeum symbiosum A]|uniref:Pyridoxamine 5'-phosphate oxidase N-terminal domain-containing protein n=1 Tax=Cenarchaeum symbiosum (strain A) TaxID=414004 RepID=A0RVB5_CENSY|nr:conserved hypothetical protein [Cenarchaeum symbiosum A]
MEEPKPFPKQDRDEFLKKQKLLRLATTCPDGTPHVVPVWYEYANGKINIGTNTGTQKARNVKSCPRAGFCVDEGVDAPGVTAVAGSGSANVILDSNVVRNIENSILSRYPMTNTSTGEILDLTDCIIEITPDKYYSW